MAIIFAEKGFALAAIFSFGAATYLLERWKARRYLYQKTLIAEKDIKSLYETYYSDCGITIEIFTIVWSEVASSLGLPPGKLRPADRFGKEIGFGLLVTPELDLLYDRALKRIHRLPSNDFSVQATRSLDNLETLDQYVRLIGSGPREWFPELLVS
jgi:hypothetical protein